MHSAPSVTRDGNLIVIAVEGAGHSLDFYWQSNGDPSASWHPELVAGPGSAYSAPSIAVDGDRIIIAVQGPDHSILFYWQTTGTRSGTRS